jgi:aryl carrier-like protein
VMASELPAYLKEHLPEYMVPTAWVELDALPLTPSGKVDRKALPEVGEAEGESREHVSPRTETERVLSEIRAEVLGRERVGIRDNYFELGGDSILSLQIKAQAQGRGIEFALQDLFEHQTVEARRRRARTEIGRLSSGSAIAWISQ